MDWRRHLGTTLILSLGYAGLFAMVWRVSQKLAFIITALTAVLIFVLEHKSDSNFARVMKSVAVLIIIGLAFSGFSVLKWWIGPLIVFVLWGALTLREIEVEWDYQHPRTTLGLALWPLMPLGIMMSVATLLVAIRH